MIIHAHWFDRYFLRECGEKSPHSSYKTIVSLGDTVSAGTQIVDIESKQVVLSSNGQRRTLRLKTGVYLNTSYANRHPSRTVAPARRGTPPPARMRSNPPPAPSAVSESPTDRPPPPRRPLSEWQTPEGIPIRIGDARLKNPQKWQLRRR